jgi:D-alanine-D-alanine ligase-like ATP-grasp enzyme
MSVVVLAGGLSAERDVSLRSGTSVGGVVTRR